MARELQLRAVDSCVSIGSGAPTIYYRKIGNAEAYRVSIYIEGLDLAYVKATTYRLHQTFPEPIRRVERCPSNPNCELQFFTWGVFDVSVMIKLIDGRIFDLNHPLSFGKELSAEGVRFLEETEQRPRLRVPVNEIYVG